VTIDEELSLLDENIRKLKIEYDVYFAGGVKKPPEDVEWRVRSVLKKHGEGRSLTFQQQFRFNTLAQKYAVFSDLWRRKLKIKEEGYRRPQDALLAIQGMRSHEEQEAATALGLGDKASAQRSKPSPFEFSDPQRELDQAQVLYEAVVQARSRTEASPAPSFDSFREFLCKKTSEIRGQYGCAKVEYSVELENGEIKLKARAKN